MQRESKLLTSIMMVANLMDTKATSSVRAALCGPQKKQQYIRAVEEQERAKGREYTLKIPARGNERAHPNGGDRFQKKFVGQ